MNAEYRTILKCKPHLTALLAHELPSIADKLVAGGLVSIQVCKKMKTLGVDNETKASELMDNVSSQIQLNPAKFKEFVDIVRSDPSREGLVDLLQNTLKGLHQRRLG